MQCAVVFFEEPSQTSELLDTIRDDVASDLSCNADDLNIQLFAPNFCGNSKTLAVFSTRQLTREQCRLAVEIKRKYHYGHGWTTGNSAFDGVEFGSVFPYSGPYIVEIPDIAPKLSAQ